MKNPFAAHALTVPRKKGTVTLRDFSEYPEVTATWPSRSVRRAVRFRRVPTAPGWQTFLTLNPQARAAVLNFA